MNVAVSRPAQAGLLFGLVAGALGLVLALTTASPAMALLPLVAVGGVFAWLRLSTAAAARTILFAVLVLHSPQDKPAGGFWVSPLELAGSLLFTNLSALTGVGLLPLSLFDVLLLSTAASWLLGRRAAADANLQLPRLAKAALWLFAGTMGWLLLYGQLRGGQLGAAYWQARQLLVLPLLSALFSVGLPDRASLVWAAKALVASALLKAAVGGAFFVFICLPRGIAPDYVTTHSDTVHFVAAILICALAALSARSWRLPSLWGAVALLGILVLNDRRMAWVSLFAGLVLVGLLWPDRRLRRRAALSLALLAPLGAAYVAVGFHSQAAVFRPVQLVRSMIDNRSDSSTNARHLENVNLAFTARNHPLLGTGFGHPYELKVIPANLKRQFELFLFIPHNSILWLLSLGGVVGFSLLWAPLLVGGYFAALSARHGREQFLVASGIAALAGFLLFALQAFGDMGTQSWLTVGVCAAAFAVASTLGRLHSSPESPPSAVRGATA